jgi:hypothetical protein
MMSMRHVERATKDKRSNQDQVDADCTSLQGQSG